MEDDSSTIRPESPEIKKENYAFDPSEVGIPLTKRQLIVSFIGYGGGLDWNLKLTLSLTSLFLTNLELPSACFLLRWTRE